VISSAKEFLETNLQTLVVDDKLGFRCNVEERVDDLLQGHILVLVQNKVVDLDLGETVCSDLLVWKR
jgi:hypothetical protein